MNKKIIIGIIVVLLGMVFVFMKSHLDTEIALSDINMSPPGIKVSEREVRVYGAVPVESCYLTGIESYIENRILYICFTGYKLGFSKIEGEYYYTIRYNSSDYDKISYYEHGKVEDILLYTK